VTSNIRFPGQYFDAESGFAYNRFRSYDSAVGRYLSTDPLQYSSKLGIGTRYEYVGQNPLTSIDPLGLEEYPDNFIGPLPPSGYRSSQMTTTTCGRIPPGPRGASVDANMAEAAGHFNPWWFRDQVKGDGPWDYKQQDPMYEDFGNFNYGASGSAFGFPEGVLLREAGRAQQDSGTSRPEWGDPGSRWNPWGGTPPFGDDPNDVANGIRPGINYCQCRANQTK
jgi:RHS repeat-associated protein